MLFNLFNTILAPVDFSENTPAIIKQTIELACIGNSTIHLMHVIKSTGFPLDTESVTAKDIDSYDEMMKKLKQWKQAIEETIPESTVRIHLVKGIVHDKIIETAKKINPQLIIIGKKSNYNFFAFFKPLCPNELAKFTNCPILTVSKNSVNTKIKSIVVPIQSFIPKRKIDLIYVFAKQFRAKIYLVALLDKMGADNTKRNALLETYTILKTGFNNQIEYHLLNSSNLPKASLQYAESIGADMMFVNPGTETKISSLTGKYINEIIPPSSKLKILFVEPLHDK
ncbi:MAG: universal stress protein [Ferruginibacter sp.]|uniref:universal stress protein n=1 Tax=Ferruginibacter sp. TaxID=1940288 RepID=UPI002658B79E|nr:universal stress protein [Ferruginibacter sp.]MDB5276570.1 universal stress protein [Ferruginibacter sp.]